MNMWNLEQIIAAQKANVETSFALATKGFDSFQKTVDLSLQAFKSMITEGEEVTLGMLSQKDPQESVTLLNGTAGLVAPRLMSYYSKLFVIASNAQLELANVGNQQFVEQQHKLQNLIDDAARHAPAAAEPAITALKSAITATSTWCESTSKVAQQAIHLVESNAEAMGNAVSRPAKRMAEQPSRTASK
jgi:phasin family protein